MAAVIKQSPELVTRHPEWFGIRRSLDVPRIERFELKARDGAALQLHRVPGGNRGPVLLSPGTAMSGLSYLLDTVDRNFVEYLCGEGFDVWLFDWRTSPELAVHTSTYTMDDVARNDWPVAVDRVRALTGAERVAIFAHCLSSVALHLALVRGYLPGEQVSRIVASQVALHLVFNRVGRIKQWSYVDRLIPPRTMLHARPPEVTHSLGDILVSVLAPIIPKSYKGGAKACHRHSVMFGDLQHIQRLNQATVELMGSLIPECSMSFLRDAAELARMDQSCALDSTDHKHLDRLSLPIVYVVGEHNNMFVPESTRRTFELLCAHNGAEHYGRVVIDDYGHIDCVVGETADRDTFPMFVEALDPPSA